jgi:hypothetical protein
VWRRRVNGLILTFHLAGINNQNFLMRDEETGTYWQQISGLAISGPLAGQSLTLVHSDELTFRLWKAEQPAGTILRDDPAWISGYSPKDWDVRMKSVPTVLTFAEHGLKDRDLMLGIRAFGEARAYPYDLVLAEKLIQDRIGSKPVLLVVGPDGKSVRAFRAASDFYRTPDGAMIDSATGSRWNFQGCAVEGKAKGSCLEPLDPIADYWFDWRNYNPATTVYAGSGRRQRQ